MGIFGKLAFWKKKDDFDFDELANRELGRSAPVQDNLGLNRNPDALNEKPMFSEEEHPFSAQPSYPQFGQPSSPQNTPSQYSQPASNFSSRDLDLINSKLDTLKALLNSLDQRLANLERANSGSQQKRDLW